MTVFLLIIKRLILVIPTLFLILLTNFAIIQTAPSGPIEYRLAQIDEQKQAFASSANPNAYGGVYRGAEGLSDNLLGELRQQYGFHKPPKERFWQMVDNYAHFELGQSFFRGQSVASLIADKMLVSVSLGLWSLLAIYAIAVPIGAYQAMRAGGITDKLTTIVLALLYAIPAFVLAIGLLTLFASGSMWRIFPLQGVVSEEFASLPILAKISDYFWHLALPLIASSVGGLASVAYLARFSLQKEYTADYVKTAYAKGLSIRQVITRHIIKNACLPFVAELPFVLTGIFAGNFLIEIVFNLDGMGLLAYESVLQKDYPVMFGLLFVFTLLAFLFQLIADILMAVLDPRIKF